MHIFMVVRGRVVQQFIHMIFFVNPVFLMLYIRHIFLMSLKHFDSQIILF